MRQLTLGVAALVCVASGRASAQPSGAQAESLFRQGKDLLAKGKTAEACAAFDASQKLDPTNATLLNQASCREKNGQLATAWGLFLEAERQTRTGTDAGTKAMHATAADHAAKLEPRLSTLTISVPAGARVGGLEILRNNEPVDPGAWNKALPVDGGSYTVTARAPGNSAWTSSATVAAERDAKTIEIPRLKAAALRPDEPVATVTPQVPKAVVIETHHRSKALPIAFTAGAVVLGGGALGFALWGNSQYDDAKKEPDNAKQDSLWKSANKKRYVAEGLGIASVACAGVAVWLFLRGDEHAPTQTALVPVVGGDQAGLVLTGGF